MAPSLQKTRFLGLKSLWKPQKTRFWLKKQQMLLFCCQNIFAGIQSPKPMLTPNIMRWFLLDRAIPKRGVYPLTWFNTLVVIFRFWCKIASVTSKKRVLVNGLPDFETPNFFWKKYFWNTLWVLQGLRRIISIRWRKRDDRTMRRTTLMITKVH